MNEITYPYRRTSTNTCMVVMGATSLVLGIPSSLCVAISFFHPPTQENFLETPGAVCVMCWMGVLLVMLLYGAFLGGYTAYDNLRAYEATLTGDTFSYGPSGHPKTIRLSDIVSVTMGRFPRKQPPRWQITLKDIHNQKIKFYVDSSSVPTSFDYQAILSDLLPRVPSIARVDERVQRFAATGKIT